MTPLSIEHEPSAENKAGAGFGAMSVAGRRALVAVLGGVLALGSGAGVAAAFRVSPQPVSDAVDQTVPDELPSEAAARNYALNNPPSYPVAFKTPSLDMPSEEAALGASDPRTDISDAPDEDAAPPQPSPPLAAASDDAKAAPPPVPSASGEAASL